MNRKYTYLMIEKSIKKTFGVQTNSTRAVFEVENTMEKSGSLNFCFGSPLRWKIWLTRSGEGYLVDSVDDKVFKAHIAFAEAKECYVKEVALKIQEELEQGISLEEAKELVIKVQNFEGEI